MLGYILCTFFGVVIGFFIAGMMQVSHNADILSEKIMESVERGEKKLED
jgi:hypothetical protein